MNKDFIGCVCFSVDSDAHSTTSSVSPAQSPSYSNQSDDGSDIESKQRRSTPSIFSFLDRSYWKRYPSSDAPALILKALRENVFSVYSFLFFPLFRQKVCCGIVYKGRFGEVIIDPRLFKPCCSSKKQTLGSTQVATRLPDTIPQQLQEDVKENWWLLLLNPSQGYLGIRLSLSPVADLHVSIPPMKFVWFFFLLNVSFYVGIFLHFCIESIFSFIKKGKKKRKKYYGH